MAVDVYHLYLDESETHDMDSVGKWVNQIFCIGGIVVKEDIHNNFVIPKISSLKNQIWSDKPNYNDLIFHEKDIKFAQNNKNKYRLNEVNEEYRRFRARRYNKMLYSGIEDLLSNPDIFVMAGCIIDNELKKHYHKDISTDKYLIALQILIENYCHFLKSKNAVGLIFYESIGDAQNNFIRRRFNLIENMGTMYVNPKAVQNLISNIYFPLKGDNIAGLQVADFIPNIVTRKVANKNLGEFNIYQTIRTSRYDGGLGKYDRFGIKIMP